MEDISIELLEKIQKEFEEEFLKNKKLESIYKKIFDGKADYEEAQAFALELGDMLQGILEKHLKAENMPNGKIYQNIAEKILRPTLKNNYELTTDVTTAVQGLINTSRGINIQPMVPEFPEDKINGIILNTVNENRLSTDVVETFTMGVVDSAIESNFQFAREAGLKPIPKRIVVGNCCDWCKEVAGKVNPDADLYDIGFYRRHKSCKCLILMDYGRRMESVHSKQQYKSIEEAMAGEHAYLGALDKLTRQQRYDRKNAAYRAYYRNKRLQNGKTYKARNKAERGKDYNDSVLDAQRKAIKEYNSIQIQQTSQRVKNILSEQLNKLDANEKKIISEYTGNLAQMMNLALATGKNIDKYAEKIRVLDGALEKGIVTENIVVQRKTIPEFLNVFPEGHIVTKEDMFNLKGKILTNKNYTSTTLEPFNYPGRNVIIEMKIPKGYQGALFIRNIARPRYKKQNEMLFKRNMEYLVQKVEFINGNYIMYVEVL